MSRLYFFVLMALLGLSITGCTGTATPALIASYPQNPGGVSGYPVEPHAYAYRSQVVYKASLELTVGSVDKAARQAEELAYTYGGYLVSSQTWYRDGKTFTSLVLAVPAVHFDGLHNELLELGQLEIEHISGELVDNRQGGWAAYSEISLSLLPRSFPAIVIPSSGWNPLSTLQSAFDVFLTIFGFIVDIAIWIVVVAGPFVLLAWIGSRLFHRWRH